MRILLLTFLFFSFASQAVSQGEGGIWYFGNTAGINFCSGAPIPLLNGALSTNEGCATICDANCNLMFYTDGITVWNANHQPMPNSTAFSPGGSLLGDPSATQSGVIVPRPMHPNLYYIFTVDDNIQANGCRYSLIDMNLQGGLGDVVPTEKNVLLFTPSSEKITAVNHANGYDIWVITHPWNTNMFFTYLVSANGLNVVPVISNTGTPHTGGAAVSRGYSKASPSGEYVALAIEGLNKYELFQFNNLTGQLNLLISWPANYTSAYGIEFSPDGNYLYGSLRWGTPLYQWDLTGNATQVIGSQVQIGTLSTPYGGALQLAIDNKIYLARSGQQHLGVIHFPNNPGATSTYIEVGVPLAGRTSREGLPTFITSYFNIADFTFQHQCEGDTTTFNISNTQQLDSAHWNFGDPASGINNTSSLWQPYHIFTSSGLFDVELITFRGGQGDTVVIQVEVYPYAIPSLPSDTLICLGSTINLNAGNAGMDYLWSNGATTQSNSYLPPDTITYHVTITNHGCAIVDSIVVYPYHLTSDFTYTTPACPNNPINLNYTGNAVPGSSFNWSFSGATLISGSGQGPYNLYWETPNSYAVSLQVVQGACSSSLTTYIITNPEGIDISITGNDALCKGDNTAEVFIAVSGANPPYTYMWNSGANTQHLIGVIAGSYSVTVTYSGQCSETASFVVSEPNLALVAQGIGDNIVCNGDTNGVVSILPSGGTPPYYYYWGVNGATTQSIGDLHAGYYAFTLSDANNCETNSGGLITEPSAILIYGSPDQFICPGETVEIETFVEGGVPPYTIHWEHDNSISEIVEVSPDVSTIYPAWVQDSNGCVVDGANSQVHVFQPVVTALYTALPFVCEGDSISIYASHSGGAGAPFAAYLSDGTPVVFPMILAPTESVEISAYAMDRCERPGTIASIHIEVVPNPSVSFAVDEQIGCDPFEVNFDNIDYNASFDYLWLFAGNGDNHFESEAFPTHLFTYPGYYDVLLKATNEYGCSKTVSVQDYILVLAKPHANFIADPESVPVSKPIVFFENITQTDYVQTYWSFEGEDFLPRNAQYLSHTFSDSGWFNVQMIVENSQVITEGYASGNAYSCYDTSSISVYVYEVDIFMAPNVINLTSDNPENQVFRPFIYGEAPIDYHLIIYNRWGERIFETFDYYRAWDGRGGNRVPLKSDNYVWIAGYKDKYGNPHQHTGNVLLLY